MADHTMEEKELSCRDFRQDCSFTVRARTEKEILNKCQAHVCSAHGKCSISSEVRDKMRSHIPECDVNPVEGSGNSGYN